MPKNFFGFADFCLKEQLETIIFIWFRLFWFYLVIREKNKKKKNGNLFEFILNFCIWCVRVLKNERRRSRKACTRMSQSPLLNNSRLPPWEVKNLKKLRNLNQQKLLVEISETIESFESFCYQNKLWATFWVIKKFLKNVSLN